MILFVCLVKALEWVRAFVIMNLNVAIPHVIFCNCKLKWLEIETAKLLITECELKLYLHLPVRSVYTIITSEKEED